MLVEEKWTTAHPRMMHRCFPLLALCVVYVLAVVSSNSRTRLQDEQDRVAMKTVPNISVAACHKTLFGSVQIDRVIHWANYHHQLGVQHIFIWYLPDVASYQFFDDLRALPYVTLIPNDTPVEVKEVYPNYFRVVGDLDQRKTETLCLTEVAKDYDWVFFGDADEFLWFRDRVSIQEFLDRYSDMSYLSFGKNSYDLQHRVATHPELFGLSQFPFTLGPFCLVRPTETDFVQLLRGHDYCPRHPGKAKLIVRPSHHSVLKIHGDRWPNPLEGSMHFRNNVAHIKEWSNLFRDFSVVDVLPLSREVEQAGDTSIRAMTAGYAPNERGTYTLTYDSDLLSWFQFVAERLP